MVILKCVKLSTIEKDVSCSPCRQYLSNWKFDAQEGRMAPTFPAEYALFTHVMVF